MTYLHINDIHAPELAIYHQFREHAFSYDGSFIADSPKVVKKDEPFALICRVGSRTGMVSEFLSEKLGYKVIDLQGGIMKMIQEGYKTVPYQP